MAGGDALADGLTVSEAAYDAIVVGAGAAGCVLASRLTEDSDRRVLLLEAGADATPDAEHAAIRDPWPVSRFYSEFCWPGLTAEVGPDPGGDRPRFSRPYLQGCGVGGTSNINGMIALRGQPEDYDEWRQLGAVGWGWEDVLPYFRRLENDLDFEGPLHGRDGPVPVRRVAAPEMAPVGEAFAAALMDRGYPAIEDLNGDYRPGVGPIPMNNLADRRVSASMAYLTEAVRRRPNLTIRTRALVERVTFEGRRATGVSAAGVDGQTTFRAREVLLAAGALQSPALLMRSGIGPADHLRELEVAVLIDRPAVGRHLLNHPEVSVAMHLPRRSMQPASQRSFGQNCLRFSSGLAGCPDNDMLLVAVNKASWHPLGRRIGALGISVYKSYSEGSVRLKSAEAAAAPDVRFALLSDPRDFERLVGGLKFALQLLGDPRMRAVIHEPFLPDGKLVGALSRPTAWNWLRAFVIALAFDGPGSLRRSLLGGSKLPVETLVGDIQALRAIVTERAQPVHHVCGTCRMGPPSREDVVVGPDGRVIGVDGLRVVDASIMPAMVRANTHFPVLMIAEKMAHRIVLGR